MLALSPLFASRRTFKSVKKQENMLTIVINPPQDSVRITPTATGYQAVVLKYRSANPDDIDIAATQVADVNHGLTSSTPTPVGIQMTGDFKPATSVPTRIVTLARGTAFTSANGWVTIPGFEPFSVQSIISICPAGDGSGDVVFGIVDIEMVN
jgi:hypothetical protein